MAMNIPIGFRFIPTDEELIRGFLWPRLMGMELPWNGIVEKDIYGDNAEPWKVFADVVDGWETKKEGSAIKSSIYAFTTLKNVSNSKRISRRAGGGTWGGQTGPKKIIRSDTGEIIGHSKMFSFERDDKAAPEDFGHWIMHEYSLSGRANDGDLVVCKITNCIKVSAASKKRAAQIDQDQLAVGCKKQKILFRAVEEEGFIVGDQSGQPSDDIDNGFVKSLTAVLDVEIVGDQGFPAVEEQGFTVGDESGQPSDDINNGFVKSLIAGLDVEIVGDVQGFPAVEEQGFTVGDESGQPSDDIDNGFVKSLIVGDVQGFPAVEEQGFIVGDESGQASDVDDDFVQSLIAGLDVEFVGGAGDESWLSSQF